MNVNEIEVFSLDADIQINELKKLPALSLNETKRMFLACINQNKQPNMAIANYFYDPDTRASFTVPANPQLAKSCVAKWGSPKIKFGTVVGVYPGDQYGNVAPSIDINSIQLYIFVFSTDKYPMLKQLNSEWGLAEHDILCTCTEATFQKWTILACKDALYLNGDPAAVEELRARADQAFADIRKFLPKQLSDQEIMVKLGQVQSQMPMAQNPFRPMAPQVGTQPVQQVAYQPQAPQPQVQNQPNRFMTPPTPQPQINPAGQDDFKDFVAQK